MFIYSVVVNLKTTCQQHTKEFLSSKGFDLYLVGNVSDKRIRINPNTPFVLMEESHIHCVANLEHFPDEAILAIMDSPEVISVLLERKKKK